MNSVREVRGKDQKSISSINSELVPAAAPASAATLPAGVAVVRLLEVRAR